MSHKSPQTRALAKLTYHTPGVFHAYCTAQDAQVLERLGARCTDSVMHMQRLMRSFDGVGGQYTYYFTVLSNAHPTLLDRARQLSPAPHNTPSR